jgi:hypothetical protein
LDITHKIRNAKCRCYNLKKTINIGVRMSPVELKKAAISTVRNSQIQSFRIRAEGKPCQFTKESNLLSLCIVLLGVKHMLLVSRLSHTQKIPLRSKVEGVNSTNVSL